MIRAAVIGVGVAGHSHTRFYTHEPDVKLVAVVDPQPNQYTQALPRYVQRYDSLPSFWQAEPNVDVISVCSPPVVHHDTVLDVTGRGVSCICEKPLTSTWAEAVALIASPRVVAPVVPVHNYSYSPWWTTLKSEALDYAGWDMLTVRMERPHAAAGVASWRADWRTVREISGGGLLWDIGVHALYLAQDLFGAAPLSATALSWQERAGCEIECEVLFEFPEDRRMNFIGSWVSSRRVSDWRVGTHSGGQPVPAAVHIQRRSPTGTGRWLRGVFDEYLSARRGSGRWRMLLRSAAIAVLAVETARASAHAGGRRTVLNHAAITNI